MSDSDIPRMPESFARAIFIEAIRTNRAAELFECLLGGGSATIDFNDGQLVMVSAAEMADMWNRPPA